MEVWKIMFQGVVAGETSKLFVLFCLGESDREDSIPTFFGNIQ